MAAHPGGRRRGGRPQPSWPRRWRRRAPRSPPPADGDEAAALLDRQAFDVVVTDLKMPGRDGLALLAKIRAEQPETQVILLTAHGTVETAVQAMKAGAFDYLQKPIGSPDELRLVVSRALERRQLLASREGASRAEADATAAADLRRSGHGAGQGRRWTRWRAPTPRCCCWARPAPARRWRRAPSTRPAPRAGRPVRGRQLRGAERVAAGERAVRPREGRLHRRARPAPRAAGAGRGRHLLPRRGGRAEAGSAGQAAARAAGAALRAGGGHADADRRRALGGRHQPRPAAR